MGSPGILVSLDTALRGAGIALLLVVAAATLRQAHGRQAAGLGALRKPGIWLTMIEEIETSPALQFLCGMMELVVGVLVYLANPWLAADLLSCVMKTVGGLMIVEALSIIAVCDLYTQLWLRSLTNFHRGWAGLTATWGAVLTVLGMLRFH